MVNQDTGNHAGANKATGVNELQGCDMSKESLIELARVLVGPMENAAVNYRRVVMAVLALREHGIESDMFERETAFDPERRDRPHYLYGMRINRVKGRLFGGSDIETWGGVAQCARTQTGDRRDYVEMARPRKVNIKAFLQFIDGQANPEVATEIAQQLQWARMQVGERLLKNNVDPATTAAMHSRVGGPRF